MDYIHTVSTLYADINDKSWEDAGIVCARKVRNHVSMEWIGFGDKPINNAQIVDFTKNF